MKVEDLMWEAGYVPDADAIAGADDGYHSFRDLYGDRLALSACLWNLWAAAGVPTCKSLRHADGELCFGGGWFVVSALPPAGQVSYHYEVGHWDLFRVPERDRVPWKYDGHSPADVRDRIRASVFLSEKYGK